MSIIRSVPALAYTSTDPFVPAGMIAAFATVVPVRSFNTEASGRACPVDQAVRNPSDSEGMAVKFSEYACADAGILQELDRTGNVRLCLATSDGDPNWPRLAFRVSAIRQGVSG